ALRRAFGANAEEHHPRRALPKNGSGPAQPTSRPANNPGKSSRPAARTATSKPAGSTVAANKRSPLSRSARPTAEVYKKLANGQRVEAWEEIDKGLKASMKDAPGSRDVWWLVEAEYELSGGKPEAATMAAMKVIAIMPDSPYYAEALLLSG